MGSNRSMSRENKKKAAEKPDGFSLRFFAGG